MNRSDKMDKYKVALLWSFQDIMYFLGSLGVKSAFAIADHDKGASIKKMGDYVNRILTKKDKYGIPSDTM